MRSGNKEINSFVAEQIIQARVILDRVLKHLSADASSAVTMAPKQHDQKLTGALDFSMPIRAFIKKYSGRMSGPKKFTLMLAYLAKGNLDKEIMLTDIEDRWNRMTSKSLLGMKFNRFYSSQAKENDWVHASKQGSYHLRPNWKSILT